MFHSVQQIEEHIVKSKYAKLLNVLILIFSSIQIIIPHVVYDGMLPLIENGWIRHYYIEQVQYTFWFYFYSDLSHYLFLFLFITLFIKYPFCLVSYLNIVLLVGCIMRYQVGQNEQTGNIYNALIACGLIVSTLIPYILYQRVRKYKNIILLSHIFLAQLVMGITFSLSDMKIDGVDQINTYFNISSYIGILPLISTILLALVYSFAIRKHPAIQVAADSEEKIVLFLQALLQPQTWLLIVIFGISLKLPYLQFQFFIDFYTSLYYYQTEWGIIFSCCVATSYLISLGFVLGGEYYLECNIEVLKRLAFLLSLIGFLGFGLTLFFGFNYNSNGVSLWIGLILNLFALNSIQVLALRSLSIKYRSIIVWLAGVGIFIAIAISYFMMLYLRAAIESEMDRIVNKWILIGFNSIFVFLCLLSASGPSTNAKIQEESPLY